MDGSATARNGSKFTVLWSRLPNHLRSTYSLVWSSASIKKHPVLGYLSASTKNFVTRLLGNKTYTGLTQLIVQAATAQPFEY